MYWPQAVLARPLPESRTLAVPDRFLVIARDASRPPGISLSRGLLQPLEKPDQVRELERGQRAGQALDRLMSGGNPGGRLQQRANELNLVASGSQPAEVRAGGAGSAPRRGMTSAACDLPVFEEKLFPFARIGQMTEGELTQPLDVGGSRGGSSRECDLRIDLAADGLKGLFTRAAERWIGIAGGLAIDRLGPRVGHHAERRDRLRTQVRVGLAGAGGQDQPRDGLAELKHAGR